MHPTKSCAYINILSYKAPVFWAYRAPTNLNYSSLTRMSPGQRKYGFLPLTDGFNKWVWYSRSCNNTTISPRRHPRKPACFLSFSWLSTHGDFWICFALFFMWFNRRVILLKPLFKTSPQINGNHSNLTNCILWANLKDWRGKKTTTIDVHFK